jgi:hypothetical protein
MIGISIWAWCCDIPLRNFIGDITYSCNDSRVTIFEVPLFAKILWVIVQSVSLFLLIWGFVYFRRLLACYRRNEIFSVQTFFYFSKISKIAFLWMLYAPIEGTLMALVKTMHNPPGQRTLSITFGSSDISNIFIVGFLYLIASLIHEGYNLKKDQDLTV